METKHAKYQRLIARCQTLPPVPTAVVHPCDRSSLEGAVEAAQKGLILPILVGPRARIASVATECKLSISDYPIVDATFSEASAAAAVQLVREGKVEALMKGSLHTDELMAEVVRLRCRAAHRPARQSLLHHGRARTRGPADRDRRCGEHRTDAGGKGRHPSKRDRPCARASVSGGTCGDPFRNADRQPELGPKGIRVHAISPGPLKTRAASGLKDFDLLLNEAAERAPLGELVDIMDVGYTCAFLAMPYARRVLGETLYVDGAVSIMA